jgi:hypothetical protein
MNEGPRRVLFPRRAHEDVPDALGVIGGVERRQRRGLEAGGLVEEVGEAHEALRRLGHARGREGGASDERRGIAGVERAEHEQVVAVVVEEGRGAVSRVVADRRDAVERRRHRVEHVRDRASRVVGEPGEVFSGRLLPHVVDAEEVRHGDTVAGALARAAAPERRVDLEQLTVDLGLAEEVEVQRCLGVLRVGGEAEQHGRAEEREVIVVHGVIDGPAAPRHGLPAPARLFVMPDVEHGLVAPGDPARPLLVGHSVEAPVEDHGHVPDARPHLEVAVGGDERRGAGGHERLVLGDHRVDVRDGEVGVGIVPRQRVHERGVPALKIVGRVPFEGRVHVRLVAIGGGRRRRERRREPGLARRR